MPRPYSYDHFQVPKTLPKQKRSLRRKDKEALAKSGPQPEQMGEALARYLARAGVPSTSGALAVFLAELNMPPTLLELSQQEGSEGGVDLATSQPPTPGSFELAREEEPWEPAPGGPELSASGKLIRPGAAPTAVAPLPSHAARGTQAFGPPHTPEPELELDLPTSTRSLAEEAMDSQAASSAPRVADARALELEARAQREETVWEPQKRRFPWGKVVVGLGVLAALGAGVVLLRPQLEDMRRTANARLRTTTVLTIHSQPEGATVIIDGAELGTTPLVMDNIYPAQQPVPVRLTLPGHKPWKGTFTGGQAALLDVKLEKR